jgi:hypothetical protein
VHLDLSAQVNEITFHVAFLLAVMRCVQLVGESHPFDVRAELFAANACALLNLHSDPRIRRCVSGRPLMHSAGSYGKRSSQNRLTSSDLDCRVYSSHRRKYSTPITDCNRSPITFFCSVVVWI